MCAHVSLYQKEIVLFHRGNSNLSHTIEMQLNLTELQNVETISDDLIPKWTTTIVQNIFQIIFVINGIFGDKYSDVPFDDDEIAFNVLCAQESFVDWIEFIVDFVLPSETKHISHEPTGKYVCYFPVSIFILVDNKTNIENAIQNTPRNEQTNNQTKMQNLIDAMRQQLR